VKLRPIAIFFHFAKGKGKKKKRKKEHIRDECLPGTERKIKIRLSLHVHPGKEWKEKKADNQTKKKMASR